MSVLGVQPIERTVAKMSRVIDEERLALCMLTIHEVNDEIQFNVGTVSSQAELLDGLGRVGPPLESFVVVVHQADMWIEVPTVLQIGVDSLVRIGIENELCPVNFLFNELEVGERIVFVGQIAGRKTAMIERIRRNRQTVTLSMDGKQVELPYNQIAVNYAN